MQAGHTITRTSCTAQNAFNPSSALLSTFLSSSSHSSVSRTQCKRARTAPQQRPHANLTHVKYFSNTACSAQEPQESILENGGPKSQQGRRLGVGSMYANYETLKNDNGPPTATMLGNFGDRSDVPQERVQGKEFGKQRWSQTRYKRMLLHTHIAWKSHIAKIKKLASQFSKEPFSSPQERILRTKRLSYLGLSIDPAQSYMDNSMPLPWHLSSEQTSGKHAKDILAMEIDRFVEYAAPTTPERVAREAVVVELKKFIAERMPAEVESEVFGSEKTGLAMPTSDIDIRLSLSEFNPRELISEMKYLLSAMKKSDDYTAVNYRYAQYQLISAQHKKTGIDIQIVFAPKTDGQQEVTMQYMNELPHLRALYMVLRTAFGMREFHEVYNGGIGSYGLLVMLVASLKRRSSSPPVSKSDQLLRFFEFYSDFDPARRCITLTPPKLFRKHTGGTRTPVKNYIAAAERQGDDMRAGRWAIGQMVLYQPYLLCLQDPANPFNDLGRKSNAIKHIFATIKELKSILHSRLVDASPKVEEKESILLPLVGRCHETYYERRKKVEEYGMEVLRSRKREQEGSSASKEPVQLTAEA